MADARTALNDKVASFPTGPGVYTFLDAKSRIVYVGKAKNLRARVRSYLREDADDGRLYFKHLVASIADAHIFLTTTEAEALLLENTLIKRHKPKWNVKLTDDKSFLQLELTSHHPWPKVQLVRSGWRKGRKPKGEVFGPYSSSRAVRETLRHIKRYFPLRTCSDVELRNRQRACIEFEMNRCVAPCVRKVTPDDYAELVDEVRLFLQGKNETLVPKLEGRMKAHAQALRFEQAARLRDQIATIRRTLEEQRVSRASGGDQDVIGVAGGDGVVVVQVVEVRDGHVTDPRSYELRTLLSREEALNAFLGQYYTAERYVPREVVLPCDVEDRELLEEVLSERRGVKVQVKTSTRGDRRHLVQLAEANARLALATGDEKRRLNAEVLRGVQELLHLGRYPRRVECFDISTIQGSFTVASQVRFVEGDPAPEGYRTYKIRTVEGQDDFAAMEEVIERRLTEGMQTEDLPDLLIVDGGPPQLRRAVAAARRVGVPPQRTVLVGLAKARKAKVGVGEPEDERAEGLREFERVHLASGGEPIVPSPASLECRFLARVRDAAHRTAITYHRELRRRSALRSGLEEVPGVGPKRRTALLARFGSLKGIRAATREQLEEVVPASIAKSLQDYLGSASGDHTASEAP